MSVYPTDNQHVGRVFKSPGAHPLKRRFSLVKSPFQALFRIGRQLTDRPGIVFFAKCVNAIKTIPTLTRSERDPEDIDERASDDAFDSVRYAIQHRRGRGARMVGIAGL